LYCKEEKFNLRKSFLLLSDKEAVKDNEMSI
jgi:hypothetical protein